MKSIIYYTTPGIVQDYAIDKFFHGGQSLSFPEAVAQLKVKNKLSAVRLPFPAYHENMDTDAFNDLVRSLPVNASHIIDNYHQEATLNLYDENDMIPFGKDVFCVKNQPVINEQFHSHSYMEMIYAYAGSLRLAFEHETLNLVEGDLCIIAPHSSHKLVDVPDKLCLTITVRQSTFDAIFSSLLASRSLLSLFFRNTLYNNEQSNYLLLKTGTSQTIRRAIQQLTYETNRDDPYANACGIGLLNLLLAQVLREYSDTIHLSNIEAVMEKTFDFTLVLQYIQQHYKTVTLASLAEIFHFSEAYLSKLFQKNMGKTFSSIICSMKMHRAVDLLLNTELKISEVAERTGYNSVDHFSRTFKSVYKTPPLAYRKTHDQSEITTRPVTG